jgi:hypothetical protein
MKSQLSLQEILEFLPNDSILPLQRLSRRFYFIIVPNAMRTRSVKTFKEPMAHLKAFFWYKLGKLYKMDV